MSQRNDSRGRTAPPLAFVLLVILLAMLWVSGGASRADVIAQVVARATAWAIAIVWILFAPQHQWRRPGFVATFLFAILAVVALQLVPLPPSLWLQLPGRALFAEAAVLSGQEQPWRPISISPSATLNALSSLIVPVVTLLVVSGISRDEERRLVPILIGLIFAASMLGVLQFSGARVDHPLLNDVFGAVSANFANRNHFALFAALGCLLAPAWAFGEGRRTRWRGPVAIALVLFSALLVLATGSRMGMVVGAVAVVLGVLAVRREVLSELKRLPKRVSAALLGASVALLGLAIFLSVTLNRAVSVDRAIAMDIGEDMRAQALPTLMDMIAQYFPIGSGFGAFDPVYRISEPEALLSSRYFNHAHNDFIEIVLDGGVIGILLLCVGIAWWAWKSVPAWMSREHSPTRILQRLGSGILLLVMLASVTDYPARTPLIMALVVIGAVWLSRPVGPGDGTAGESAGNRRESSSSGRYRNEVSGHSVR